MQLDKCGGGANPKATLPIDEKSKSDALAKGGGDRRSDQRGKENPGVSPSLQEWHRKSQPTLGVQMLPVAESHAFPNIQRHILRCCELFCRGWAISIVETFVKIDSAFRNRRSPNALTD